MSYDLLVFDPQAPPPGRKEFMAWYGQQMESGEGHSYDNPEVSTPELRAWFLEMIEQFPAMNGPYATDDIDNPRMTDYSIGKSVIYVAFAWSVADIAYQTAFSLAQKHGIGFFDASSDDGKVWGPTPDGKYNCLQGGGPEKSEHNKGISGFFRMIFKKFR
ncbi:MAG: hypothetical protein ACYC7E_05700 [Armatimonadota bacterium]